jgi:hypothetical protein
MWREREQAGRSPTAGRRGTDEGFEGGRPERCFGAQNQSNEERPLMEAVCSPAEFARRVRLICTCITPDLLLIYT